MYSLFSTKPVLESILKTGEKSKWYLVLQRTNIREIFIPEEFVPNVDNPMGPQDELSAINQYIPITPRTKHLEYCKQRKKDEFIECVKKLTNALFLVDGSFDNTDLKYICEEIGIYCCRFSEADEGLFNPIKSFSLKKGKKDFSWTSFFTSLNRFPTKSAIICDRNIFSNDCQIGCKNLQSILDNLIVSGRCTNYSFAVLFEKFSDDHQERVNEQKKKDILKNLKEYLRQKILHGGLPIINAKIDLVSVSRTNPCFEITHDRVIYCDYYTVGATYAISALNKDGYSLKTQAISHSALFSSVGSGASDIIQQRKNVFPDYRKIFEEDVGLNCYRITGEGYSEILASECLNDCRILVDATV